VFEGGFGDPRPQIERVVTGAVVLRDQPRGDERGDRDGEKYDASGESRAIAVQAFPAVLPSD